MKVFSIKNDRTMLFYIIKHIKGTAEKMDWQEFINWYTIKIIIPYVSDEGKKFRESFCKAIGFKKESDIGKVYYRLKELEIKP